MAVKAGLGATFQHLSPTAWGLRSRGRVPLQTVCAPTPETIPDGTSQRRRGGLAGAVGGLASRIVFPRRRRMGRAPRSPDQEQGICAPREYQTVVPTTGGTRVKANVCLSSGFLAFALHAGFLAALEDCGVEVTNVMGTSAGAITGSLYASGLSPKQVAEELSRLPPSAFLVRQQGMSVEPYKGLLTLRGAIKRLQELLPAEFEGLPRDFSCGVVSSDGRHVVLSSGSLPEAVAASAAIPVLFCPVEIPGRDDGPFIDGGKADRVGLEPWLRHCEERGKEIAPLTICHVIARSSPWSGRDSVDKDNSVIVVNSPKSGESLLNLKQFGQQYRASYRRTIDSLLASGVIA